MFSKPDKNNKKLFKDPNGKWMVCPIVNYNFNKDEGKIIKKTLLGYISADNHININGVPRDRNNLTSSQIEFQKYALDLVADLLAPVINFESFELFVKPYLKVPKSNK